MGLFSSGRPNVGVELILEGGLYSRLYGNKILSAVFEVAQPDKPWSQDGRPGQRDLIFFKNKQFLEKSQKKSFPTVYRMSAEVLQFVQTKVRTQTQS